MFFLPLLILKSGYCVLSALAYPRLGQVCFDFFLPLLFLDSDRCVLSALAVPIVGLLCSFCLCCSYSRTVVFFLPLLFL